ncbi:hypothetical protein EVAR_68155_1 [Eumeta japonica]|uniref:Uncharacterized protein n=1 Tax=Eumeta variegata TaxID=151549 RepID=A0A4C1STE5_EUMVA|nr:hypothetical protein EVAR_68155_1 [Eumeta japonica]
MDNPRTKTDELVDKLSRYSYSVDSLQVLAWTELRNLNSEKDFLNHHKNAIRAQKLTKLDEVGYILQLIGDLNKDQSEEFTKRIEELEENKICLQAHSKKLRTQIEYTDGLLEQVVEENAKLVQQLRNKGLSEEDFSRELKQTQLINTKDDTIQRLQTALDNARRELDKIHRSRSPTPSLSEELKSTGIPSIVVHSCRKKPQVVKITRAVHQRDVGLRTIGKEQFENLQITDELLLREFESSLDSTQDILNRRAVSPGSKVQEIKMPAFSEITKIVNNIVPAFFGTDGPDLQSEVSRYIQGCKMVERELLTQAGNELTQDVIECLKLRLMSSAYTKISQLSFSTIDALCDAVKKLYLKKSLNQVREAITSCKQSIREPASKFGGRLEALLNEAVAAVRNEWSDGNSQNTMIQDFKRIANDELSSLISIVEEAEDHTGNRFCVPRRQVNMDNRSQQYSYRPTGNGGNPLRNNGTIRDNRSRNQIPYL